MPDAPHPSGLRQFLLRIASCLVRMVAAFFVLLLLLMFAVYLLFTFRPELLQTWLQTTLAERFSGPVQLSAIRTGWDNGPTLRFQQLLAGPSAHPDLFLNDVDLQLYPVPLLWGELVVRQLSVQKALLQLGKNPQGDWQPKGLRNGQASSPWLLNLDPARLDIRHVTIAFQDADQTMQLHLQWRSTGGLRPEMQVHLDWAKGGHLDYAGAAQGFFTHPSRSSGDGQWSLHALPLAWLHTLDPRFPVLSGQLNARGHLLWQDGLPRMLHSRFQWLHPGQHLDFSGQVWKRVEGQLLWHGAARSGELQLTEIRGLGMVPLSAQLQLHWQRQLQGDIHIPQIPAAFFMEIASPFLPQVWRYGPLQAWQGNLQDFRVHFLKIRHSRKIQWQLQTRLEGLDIPALSKTPRLKGLTGDLTLQARQFSLQLHSPQLEVLWPRYFAHPWVLQGVSGHISGRWQGQQWFLQAMPLRIQGPGQWQVKGRLTPQHLLLQAQLQHLPVRDIRTFVPQQGISPALQHWFSSAFRSGTLKQADLRWQGPWQRLPENHHGQQLKLQADFRNVRLHYAPHWPDLQHLDAHLQWTGNRVAISSRHGEIAGVPVNDAQVTMSELRSRRSSPLEGAVNTTLPLSKLLPFLRQTPILPHAYHLPLQPFGAARLCLALEVPFHHEKPRVQGILKLRGAGMRLGGWQVRSVSGSVYFQRHALDAQNLQGQFLGGPAQIWVHVDDRRQWVNLQWHLHGDMQAGKVPLPERWQSRLQGVIPYQLSGTLRQGKMHLSGEVRLQSSRSTLPAPLDWNYALETPIRVSGQGLWNRAFALSIQAPQGRARLDWQHMATHWQWRAAALRLGAGPLPKLPDKGVIVTGQGADLPVDAWLSLLQGGSPGGDWPRTHFDMYWQTVHLLGQVWHHAHLQGGLDGRNWHMNWQSPQSIGRLAYQGASEPTRAASIRLNLQKLLLGPASAQHPERISMPVSPSWAAGKPLDLFAHLDELDWHGYPLHHVLLEAERSDQGWHISALRGDWEGSQWDLSGVWQSRNTALTTLQGTVKSQNIAPALEALGMHSLDYGHAQYTGKISWPGAPWDCNVQHLQGNIHSTLKNGRLKKIGTELSWLVYVNPTILLKDLVTLDYRPLFGEGLFFHDLSADFTLEHGVAHSKNIRLRSSALAMHGAGTLNMVHKKMNLYLQVYPLQSFDWLLGRLPLLGPALFGHSGKVLELNYQAEGTWAHPVVTRMTSSPEKDQ
ncbi:YhdP family protein [Acidithiobacillus sp. M4-SHS-6]|uniref:YhdP family phospholipid transporter n=1 Tax=Acidithiobacillus sp. M4-SHS-6 TaxID=3383024 RepID=UPI0039BEA3B9